jgi:polar amino acid transport system substrate-binding protein
MMDRQIWRLRRVFAPSPACAADADGERALLQTTAWYANDPPSAATGAARQPANKSYVVTVLKICRDFYTLCGIAATLALIFAAPCQTQAQTSPAAAVPNYFDPQTRLDKPDLSAIHTLRFLTEDDYPPFHFALSDGTLTGFDIDLARAICETLKIACTIQARRFDLLAEALNTGEGDALIAALRIDPVSRARFDFTHPYYTTPARFVARKDATFEATPEGLAGKKIAVVGGTAQEAFLKAFFPQVHLETFANRGELYAALQSGQVDAFFDDAITSSFWLVGTASDKCCAFRGGPYTDSNYFGEGVGIAVKKGNDDLRRALDYALAEIARRGVYTDIYLKYFPVGFY